jgi:uncharacterized delta-60 repeat protein
MSSKPREIRAVRIGDQRVDDLKPVRAGALALGGLTATYLALAGIAAAAPGDLDADFNGSGLLSLRVGDSESAAFAVVQQIDGKLVLAGWGDDSNNAGFMVARVEEGGIPDSTFGIDGVAFADFSEMADIASAAIQQTDGKLVLVGSASTSAGSFDIALARFNIDGTLDASFGNGGKATLDIGGSHDSARGLVEQPGGKYVIAGSAIAAGGLYQLVFARFNVDGSLDRSFGTDGTTLVDFGSGTESFASGLAQLPGGTLVGVGSVSGPTGWDVGIARVTMNGALDPSFDGDGLLTVDNNGNIDQAFAVAIQPDHAIVVAGVTAADAEISVNYALLLRVNNDGSVDNSFVAGALPDTILNSIVVQEDGKLVATGARATIDGAEDLILTRFNSDGALDTTYGVDGVATADFGERDIAPFSSGSALIRQTDGKYVATGWNARYSFGAARFDDGAALAGRIGLTVTSQDVLETTPTVTYTVRRTGGRTGAVSVAYETAAGQAQPGSDFEDASGILTWSDGETSDKTLTINLINDSVAEADEGFTLSLSTPTGGAHLAATEAATVIASEDGPGELGFQFALDVAEVREWDIFGAQAGRISVAVERTGGWTDPVNVNYSTFAGSATAGEDFQATSGTLSWTDGERGFKSIEVAILDDSIVEGDEEFEIRLSDPTGGATIAASSGTQRVRILDNEESPSPSPAPGPPAPPPPAPPPVSGGGSGDGFLLWLLLLGLARKQWNKLSDPLPS